MIEDTPDKDAHTQMMLQIMMAEHAALQNARSSTIFDATGRANLFIGSISSVLVALAFIGQASEMGKPFFIFTLLLIVPLIFIGFTTFHRIVQIGNADTVYGRGINCIRHFYTEIAPETAPYFILPTRDDFQAMLDEMEAAPGVFQTFLSTGGMVNGLNSMLIGVFVGVLMYVLFEASPLICIIVGGLAFFGSLYLHTQYLGRLWEANEKRLKVLFPSKDAKN